MPQRGGDCRSSRKRDYRNKGTVAGTRKMVARAGKEERKMDLSTEGKESDLATIVEEVEANYDCLVEKGT